MYPRVLLEGQDEKLENVKGNELFRFSESSFSGYRQGGSQSWNANENFLNSWTPSIFVQIRGGESADHRQSKKQTSMHHYFKDFFKDRHKVKWAKNCWIMYEFYIVSKIMF